MMNKHHMKCRHCYYYFISIHYFLCVFVIFLTSICLAFYVLNVGLLWKEGCYKLVASLGVLGDFQQYSPFAVLVSFESKAEVKIWIHILKATSYFFLKKNIPSSYVDARPCVSTDPI